MKDAINAKRDDIKWNAGKLLPFIETMAVTTEQPVQIERVDDDQSREIALYVSSIYIIIDKASYTATYLAVAKHGLKELEKIPGFKWRRPDGSRADDAPFLAETVKTDEHMAKVFILLFTA